MAFQRGRMGPPRGPGSRLEWLRIPPLPPHTFMTDRDDGTVWWITYNTTISPPVDGLGRIAISDQLPQDKGDRKVYGPYAGPYLGPIRLLIRGGRLGYEMLTSPYNVQRSQHKVMARISNTSRDMREIIVPSTWDEFDDVLGWQEVQL